MTLPIRWRVHRASVFDASVEFEDSYNALTAALTTLWSKHDDYR